RVKNATFSFNNKTYHLPKNEDPNHLHGELCYKPWKVIETNVDNSNGCSITSQFKFEDHPDIMQYFPHKLVFTFTYVLKNGKLELDGKVINEGKDESPFALGFHPYFSVPEGKEELVKLTIPAINEWEITNEAFVQGLPERTEFIDTISTGMTLEGVQDLDCWLVTLDENQEVQCKISYLDKGTCLTYQLDVNIFPYLVVFQPEWTSAISLEPYTYVTDGFNLPWHHETTGVKGIKPNEQINFHLSIHVNSLEIKEKEGVQQ